MKMLKAKWFYGIFIIAFLLFVKGTEADAAEQYDTVTLWQEGIYEDVTVCLVEQSDNLAQLQVYQDGGIHCIDHVARLALTDGQYIYYSRRTDKSRYKRGICYYKYVVEKLNIATLEKQEIVRDWEISLDEAYGNYLYYTRSIVGRNKDKSSYRTTIDGEKRDSRNINVKTGKDKDFAEYVWRMRFSGKKVIYWISQGGIDNSPIYTSNLNGTKKKKIAEGYDFLYVMEGKVYYAKVKTKRNSNIYYKMYRCEMNGKKKKALTKWRKKIPKKYLKWQVV